jgi:hypothetical protein
MADILRKIEEVCEPSSLERDINPGESLTPDLFTHMPLDPRLDKVRPVTTITRN